MKIKELIKKLSEFPLDIDVLVEGYEDGFDQIITVKSIRVKTHQGKNDWWNGEFDHIDGKDGSPVVVILGNRNKPENIKKVK